MTPEVKLATVERLIEDFRWARSDPMVPEHQTYNALKALAVELRAQSPRASNKALQVLSMPIEHAQRFKACMGYIDMGHHQAISEALIGQWPVVRRALENQP